MVLASSSFPRYLHKYLQNSLKQFADPLIKQQDIEGEITNFKKTWIETSGDYFKAVTVLPQMLVGIIHFASVGGFPTFYESTFDINIVVCGVLGEGAALMYEIYRAMYYKPRWSQIFNYSLTSFVFYYYGIHKAFPIFIWKQNWLFLMIPIFGILRMKLLRKDAFNRALALIFTIILFFLLSFRLYTIYRIIDLIRLHEKPLLVIMSLEALVEIYWLYCFTISIRKSCRDEEVVSVFLCPCDPRRQLMYSTDLVADEVEEPHMKLQKYKTKQGGISQSGGFDQATSTGNLNTGDLWALAWGNQGESTQGP